MIQKVIVGDQERAIVVKKGRFETILGPGEHFVYGFGVAVQKFALNSIVFQSEWGTFVLNERPSLAEKWFVTVETSDSQVAAILLDGKLSQILQPGRRVMFWRGPVAVTAQAFDVKQNPEVPRELAPAVQRLGTVGAGVAVYTVDEGRVGLLTIDGKFVRQLQPGTHVFWSAAGAIRMDLVDLRAQAYEVPGQEILTRDKVSLRVNIWAEFQVVDAVKAKQSVKDFSDALHKALQFAIRQSLGRKTLEEVLAEKVDVTAEAAAQVRETMLAVGVRVGAIAVKDVILPGDMREILNQVVVAEKQAQANLIRRREETAATRSLLNTAKLMEENPILVRLKELETLERVVEKVDHISVGGGLESLLSDLVRINK